MADSTSERIIVVGGGFAGLAIAVRLAQQEIPVTLLEAASLGRNASLRNQGWLHSGAWFAPQDLPLARMCYESLQQTIRFCPSCIEPNHTGMYFALSKTDTKVAHWTRAWESAGLPIEEPDRQQFLDRFPGIDPGIVQRLFLLPDRSFRPDVLLARLASDARHAGVEIREHTSVSGLIHDEKRALGVTTGTGEEIRSWGVIFATGAFDWLSELTGVPKDHPQPVHERVALKTHLVAVRPAVGAWPLCVVDQEGLNHLPHGDTSVFGTNRWPVVRQPGDVATIDEELTEVWRLMNLVFPDLRLEQCDDVRQWAGTTLQLMHPEQIHPGRAPLPTVVDHSDVVTGWKNLWSVSPGRATLWVQLAEETSSRIAAAFGTRRDKIAPPPWA